jgi:hypothetical protein
MNTELSRWFSVYRGNGRYTVARLHPRVAEYLTALRITVKGPFRTRYEARLCGHVCKGNKEHCQHEWVVFSTALQEVCLMVECVKCGVFGTVDDPTKDEWRRASSASSRPYGWAANERVTVRGTPGMRHVERVP